MNNYPYNNNPYGGYPPPYPPYTDTAARQRNEKKALRRLSGFIGFGVILFVCAQLLFGLVFGTNEKLMDLYDNNLSFQLAVESVLAFIMIACPYLLIRAILNKEKKHFIPLSAGSNIKFSVMFVFIGLAACVAGNFLTYFLNEILENIFNVQFTQAEYDLPTNGTETFLYIVRSAMIPALVEELSMRGGVLQAMRKYGDWFAIVTSSFVFAILHGNMIQIPFAFIVGLALGYTFIITGSLWPCIIIHFINNFASSLIAIYGSAQGDIGAVEIIYVVYEIMIVALGVVFIFLYLLDKNRPRLNKGASILSAGQKTGAFIINVPMIISILYMAYVTAQYVE